MIAITTSNLEKIENLLSALGYSVRYEKGNFKTGACVLQNSKVIVVNKFSNLEIKINSLVQLLRDLEFDSGALDEKQATFYKTLLKAKE